MWTSFDTNPIVRSGMSLFEDVNSRLQSKLSALKVLQCQWNPHRWSRISVTRKRRELQRHPILRHCLAQNTVSSIKPGTKTLYISGFTEYANDSHAKHGYSVYYDRCCQWGDLSRYEQGVWYLHLATIWRAPPNVMEVFDVLYCDVVKIENKLWTAMHATQWECIHTATRTATDANLLGTWAYDMGTERYTHTVRAPAVKAKWVSFRRILFVLLRKQTPCLTLSLSAIDT